MGRKIMGCLLWGWNSDACWRGRGRRKCTSETNSCTTTFLYCDNLWDYGWAYATSNVWNSVIVRYSKRTLWKSTYFMYQNRSLVLCMLWFLCTQFRLHRQIGLVCCLTLNCSWSYGLVLCSGLRNKNRNPLGIGIYSSHCRRLLLGSNSLSIASVEKLIRLRSIPLRAVW